MEGPSPPPRPNPRRDPLRSPAPPAEGPRARFPEPPAFRATPLAAARACANCSSPITAQYAAPRCWGCGRSLCPDCYWRHDTAPATHRCTSCRVRGTSPTTVSSARAGSWGGVTGRAPPASP